MQGIKLFSGALVILALVLSWKFLAPLQNRIHVFNNRDQYHPAVFEVTGARYQRAEGECECEFAWLEGTVEGQTERLTPRVAGEPAPTHANGLLRHFPRGSQLEVLYNPREDREFLRTETMRVLHNTPGFWKDEQFDRRVCYAMVLIPVPATIAIYLLIRYIDVRRRASGAAGAPEEAPEESAMDAHQLRTAEES